MPALDKTLFLKKYGETIAQEVNVKEVSLIEWDQNVTIQYVPLGKMLGADFGKDTGRIIWAAKSGAAKIQDDGRLLVSQWADSWLLTPEQFEVRYSWFDAPHQIVEEDVMVELDLELTDDLIQEWVAREVSRFLNQMRKDAGYEVGDRVMCGYVSQDSYMVEVMTTYGDYLMQEALLSEIVWEKIASDFEATFEMEGRGMLFWLKR